MDKLSSWIGKLLTIFVFALASFSSSRAAYRAESSIQSISEHGISEHGGLLCADVLVQVWDKHTGADGTVYDVLVGAGQIFLGAGCDRTDPTHTECAAVPFHHAQMLSVKKVVRRVPLNGSRYLE